MEKSYYVEWAEGNEIGKAVVVAKDIATAIEGVTECVDSANFNNITVVGVIEGVKVIEHTVH